jgi:hypothetical protein
MEIPLLRKRVTDLELAVALGRGSEILSSIIACESLERIRRRVAEIAPPLMAEVLEDSLRGADWVAESVRRFVTEHFEELDTSAVRAWFKTFGGELKGALRLISSGLLAAAAVRLGDGKLHK